MRNSPGSLSRLRKRAERLAGPKGRNKNIKEKGFFRIYFREKNNLKVAR
jgi:hypothetical protein